MVKIRASYPRTNPLANGRRRQASKRACLVEFIWILRTGARLCDLSEHFPSEARVGGVWLSGKPKEYVSKYGKHSCDSTTKKVD